MPSFDVVSEVDHQEVRNAVDQTAREVATRFDFKGTDSTIELKDTTIELASASEDRLKALGVKGIQSQTQGDAIRVTGKKRDDLQAAIAALREHDFEVPLQFNNFRD